MTALSQPDKRLYAYRPDLADSKLKSEVSAGRYVDGREMAVVAPVLSLRRGPGYEHPQDSQLLHGDRADVFEMRDGWAWVQNLRDGYVGYCPADGLEPGHQAATHYVSSYHSLVFPEPDIKRHPLYSLPMGSSVTVEESNEKFARLSGGGWIYLAHLAGCRADGA